MRRIKVPPQEWSLFRGLVRLDWSRTMIDGTPNGYDSPLTVRPRSHASPASLAVEALRGLPAERQAEFWQELLGAFIADPDYDEERAEAERERAIAARETYRTALEARSVVYYLLFADRIKIGTTTNLAARLAQLPHDELLATEPGGLSVERQRHAEFASSRITGEWFADTPDLREHIATLT